MKSLGNQPNGAKLSKNKLKPLAKSSPLHLEPESDKISDEAE
jgi:hypothetical protein